MGLKLYEPPEENERTSPEALPVSKYKKMVERGEDPEQIYMLFRQHQIVIGDEDILDRPAFWTWWDDLSKAKRADYLQMYWAVEEDARAIQDELKKKRFSIRTDAEKAFKPRLADGT